MGSYSAGEIAGMIMAVVLLTALVIASLWVACLVGEVVYANFGPGGIAMLCTVLGCSAVASLRSGL